MDAEIQKGRLLRGRGPRAATSGQTHALWLCAHGQHGVALCAWSRAYSEQLPPMMGWSAQCLRLCTCACAPAPAVPLPPPPRLLLPTPDTPGYCC